MKCYRCIISPLDHLFEICLVSTCQCPCVEQLSRRYTNKREDEMKAGFPRFMEISHTETMKLPDLSHTIRMFNRVNKKEWIKIKKDKRRRNIINYQGH